ncbi:hypothetical protein [Tumebacillus flagellatus]|uniref:Uncharacterized protein n=1 Tax=Tumebacillus flagellatus TaxID=1157490 RepID=A0A074LQV8_9BACL|nr:hypothetical protein [Tumebacillus flagellatus]KEO82880.1 hypothetical protein EL26_13325 [Tumebacillus flagellatus]
MFGKLKSLTAAALMAGALAVSGVSASSANATDFLQGNQDVTGVLAKGATVSYLYNPYQNGYFTTYVSCSTCSYKVVDQDGNQAFQNFRTESPDTWWGRSDTNYYIQVTNNSNTSDANYRVWVSDSIPDTRENDNDPYWATPIQEWNPLSSYMAYPSDVDYYGYKPTNTLRQTVTLNREPGGGSLYYLYVYDSKHNLIASSEDISDETTTLDFNATGGQWYFIEVSSDDLDYNPYTIQVNRYQDLD